MNKKLLKSIVCIATGVGIASSIPFTTTSCGCSSSEDDDINNPLPDEVYDLDGTHLLGFKSGIDWTKYKGKYDTIQIPNNITHVDENAFSDDKVPVFIKHLIIAKNSALFIIDQSAFKNCSALTSISINEWNSGVIHYYAFYNCSNLSSITWDGFNGTTSFTTTSFANICSKGTVKVTNPVDPEHDSVALLEALKDHGGLPKDWTVAN